MKSGVKDGGKISTATSYAEGCRTAPANRHMTPPAGPKPEPVKVNNVPLLPVGGTSK
jgi:hypothetical protein